MSKQVKLKFKKMLKKAEFAHANLEYHEELLPEAKQEFFAKAQEVLDGLSPEVQKKIHEARAEKMAIQEEVLRSAAAAADAEEDEPEEEEVSPNEMSLSEDISSGGDPVGDAIEGDGLPALKENEIKKMFRRIASVTHPDKLEKDISKAEKERLDKIFKQAKDAYANGHWYNLYSISLDLGLPVPDPAQEHSDWLEDDIKFTDDRVSHISQLVVWVWYAGDEESKKFALRNYFQQVYDYTLDI